MNHKSNKTLAALGGAFILISFVNILSRGLGFFREVLFANYFGVNLEFDVYLVGAAIPVTLNTVILYIGQNYFIPAFNKNKLNSGFSDNSFTLLHVIIALFTSLLVSLMFYLFSSNIISLFIDRSSSNLFNTAKNIFNIFLISIPLNSIIAILIAREQAELKFTHPALSRLWLNITLIPVLIIFADKFGIYTIPIGFVTGTFLQLVYLFIKSKSFILNDRKQFGSLRSIRGLVDSTIVSILLIESIGQLYLLVDRYFFDKVQAGGISALNYASNLNLLPVSIFAVALATVVFPKLSEIISKKRLSELVDVLDDSFRAILFIFIPISLVYYFYGDAIIALLFERGAFGSDGTAITFSALKYYALSLIFYSAYSILNKTLYAGQLVNYLLIITLLGILLKISLNFVFVNTLKHDGLALSTSLSYIFFFLSSLLVINHKFVEYKPKVFLREIFFLIVINFISLLITNVLISGVFKPGKDSAFLEVAIFILIISSLLYMADYTLPGVFQKFKDKILLKNTVGIS